MVRLDDLMHRRLILETLKERDDHPTAEQIYFYVRAQADSVSRAAVYRNLRALQAQGEVVRVGQTGPERFDHIVHPHYHILCTNCGKLSNAPVDYQRKLDLEAADANRITLSADTTFFLRGYARIARNGRSISAWGWSCRCRRNAADSSLP